MEHGDWYRWTRELLAWWHYYNREYCENALKWPVIRMVEGAANYGTWDREKREICIALEHVRDDPWQEVMATLRHEMAHQFADEIELVTGQLPHGQAFRRACRFLRVEPRATTAGPDAVAATADDAAARLTRIVSKLFALGDSPNENEASAAVRKARQLMLEHNLELVERDRDRTFGMRTLGPVKRRHMGWETTLGAIVSEFFFVEVIWSRDYDVRSGKTGTRLFIHGTPANLDMAEYVHGYLWNLLPGLWDDHRREEDILGNRDRQHFFDGVLQGFLQKLRGQERERCRSERALVWRGDPRLDAYYRWLHPHVRTTQGRDRLLTPAYVAGKHAGRSVTIHRPLSQGGGGVGGQLPG